MADESFLKVKQFVLQKWTGSQPLLRTTPLEEDLGITGDDGVEFMDSFQQEFNINFPNGFDYSKHFGPDGLDLISFIPGLFQDQSKRQNTLPITLGDLEDAVIKGEWVYKY